MCPPRSWALTNFFSSFMYFCVVWFGIQALFKAKSLKPAKVARAACAPRLAETPPVGNQLRVPFPKSRALELACTRVISPRRFIFAPKIALWAFICPLSHFIVCFLACCYVQQFAKECTSTVWTIDQPEQLPTIKLRAWDSCLQKILSWKDKYLSKYLSRVF